MPRALVGPRPRTRGRPSLSASAFPDRYREERDRLARASGAPLTEERRGRAARLLLRGVLGSYLRARGVPGVGAALGGRHRTFLASLPWNGRGGPPPDLGKFSAQLEGVPERDGGQKQRGAYATAPDVADCVARNSILPFLLTSLRGHPSTQPGGELWRLPRVDPDRYLHAAVRHGADEPLPGAVARGLADVAARHGWNGPVPRAFGPPGETWREHVARRQRCHDLRRRLRGGHVRSIADLIAGNVDLPRLVDDLLGRTTDAGLLVAVWGALRTMSVLDPTCGTGAFLFAALRTLEPVHATCLLRMEELLGGGACRRPRDRAALSSVLAEEARFSSRRLFVLSSIVRHNLFGLDLAEEAIELCRLRLRLEVAACAGRAQELARLPEDNLRCGNALVGRARPGDERPRRGQCPFDWPEAFPAVAARGGFDVVLGNPPYLELREVGYDPPGFALRPAGAVHALCVERGLALLQPAGRLGMVLPLAVASTQRMRCVQAMLEEGRDAWYGHFGWRPATLFAGVNRAVTVVLAAPCEKTPRPRTWSTGYQKWPARDRPSLMERTAYVEVPRPRPSFWVPKLGEALERGLLAKFLSVGTTVGDFVLRQAGPGDPRVYYRTDGGLYWKVFTDFPPAFHCNGRAGPSTRETSFAVADGAFVRPLVAALSSDLFWWWYTVTSNCRHLNPTDVYSFPLPAGVPGDARLAALGRLYLGDLVRHSRMRVRNQRQTGRTETQSFRARRSRPLVEQVDRALAGHYRLTAEELDFVMSYEVRFRLGTH